MLLIDDSLLSSATSINTLKQFNFEVIHARDSKSGYDILNKRFNEITVIFMDVVMPEVDGIECLSWITGNNNFQHIPVYILSGLDDSLLRTASTEKGAVDMILKPLTEQKLRKVILDQNIEIHELDPDSEIALSKAAMKVGVSDDLSPSYDSTDAVGESHPGALVGRKLAPSFQLSDSEFKLFSYPADAVLEYTLVIFVPSIFYSALYDQSGSVCEGTSSVGFMNQLVEYYEALLVSVNVVMISGDLPFALNAAKHRFNLPFRLLSDPSLAISYEFVGIIDIGDVVGRTDFDEIAEENAKLLKSSPSPPPSPSTTPTRKRNVSVKSKFRRKNSSVSSASNTNNNNNKSKVQKPQSAPSYQSSTYRSSLGPNLGFILVNKQRDIIKKSIFSLTRSAFTKCISLPVSPVEWIRLTCMLVDDSQLYLKSLSKVIESCGMTARCYSTAHAALDDLRKPEYIPSLLLIDIVMPDCDGLTLLNLIRGGGDGRSEGIPEVSNVPMVMMSDLPVVGQAQLLASCRDMGAYDVLKKPFNKERFLRLLQQLGLA